MTGHMTIAVMILAAVTVGTWNGQWFPSGRAEHRAAPEAEARTIAAAGRLLRDGLAKADPTGTNDVILCLNEIRGPKEANALCEAIGRKGLRVAVVTGYRRRDRFDQQQDVIATTLPVADASWSRWKGSKGRTPPRGYARASVVLSPGVTGVVYSVHLKSNYGQTDDGAAYTNRLKRTLAVEQLLEQERNKRGRPRQRPAIVAGDFNADRWSEEFKADTMFAAMESEGFDNALALLPSSERATHPARGKWKDRVFDYIMYRSLKPKGLPKIVPSGEVSDHSAVFVTLECGS